MVINNNNNARELPIPVEEIISLIQIFEGNLNELEPFVRNTDGVWDLLDRNYQNTHKLRVALAIRSKLKGKASEAIRDLTDNSWPAIRTLLRTNLRPQEGPKLALLQMSKIRQGHTEGLDNYAKRTTELLQLINLAIDPTMSQETQTYIKTENESKAKDAFEDGLYDKLLRERVIAANLTTLRQAMDYAREQEIRLIEEKRRFAEARCNYCHIQGHIEDECRKKLRNQRSQRSSPDGHGPICYNCGQRGHYARDCEGGEYRENSQDDDDQNDNDNDFLESEN